MTMINLKNKEINIDDKCYPLVKLFNDMGLPTRHSCEGHGIYEFSIIFEDEVTDKQIEDLLLKYINKYGHSHIYGKFQKWCRVMNNKIKYSWMYIAPSVDYANRDYKILINI